MRSITSLCIRMSVFFFLSTMAGCGDNSQATSDSNSIGDSIGDDIMMSALVRDTDPQVSDADLAAVVGGNADFALKAFPLLDAGGGSNTVYSPYSVTLAIALTAAGAKGTTLSGIEAALSFSLPQERLNPAFNKLDLLLATKTTGTIHQGGSQSPRLNIANAIWGQRGFPLQPEYLDTIALNYGAGLRLADFINAPENSRVAINSWVEEQTNSRIRDLIPKGGITPDTRVVITNAIWFKANWASQFKVENTMDMTFFGRDNSSSTVPFMHRTLSLPYAQGNGWQAVDIPYVDGNLSMLVLMPDPGTFDEFLSSLTPAKLGVIAGLLTNREIALAMPRFTFSTALDMRSVLSDLGMGIAFEQTNADFSGIDGNRDLHIDGVIHQAFINVDESGTEAAAATAVNFGVTGIPAEPLALTVDHPFIFMIRDREIGLILFLGKVVAL